MQYIIFLRVCNRRKQQDSYPIFSIWTIAMNILKDMLFKGVKLEEGVLSEWRRASFFFFF